MKINLIIFCFLPIISFSQFFDKKTYNIQRTDRPPQIDGVLNDQSWQNLDIAKNFTQLEPSNGKKEKYQQRTEVKICYDDKNIYFGVMMYDNSPDSILKELSKRDEENKNFDKFGIWIDPFNNSQLEYNFTVTSAGVQIDRKFSPSGIDVKWDAVWESSVKINDKGWIAEFAIPFSQLRFPNNNKKWALNMMRSIRRYREDYSWNPINVSFKNFALQAGILSGIKNIKSPIRLSFMPYISTYMKYYDDQLGYPYNYGLDLKYGINESFTLDMTLIPDFGQVASDAKVSNLTTKEIKYDEKRQFFNEGTELFNKGGDMFYSRRVPDDLLNATKITGRTKNGLGIALMNIIANKTAAEPLSNYNVMIFDQTFGNNSSLSLMNTHMIQKGNHKDANVTGIFTKINNKNNTHTYSGEIKMSQEFLASELIRGFSGKIEVEKTNGNYRYRLYSLIEDEKYNPTDMGIYTEDLLDLTENNEIRTSLELSYNQFKENNKFINSEISSSINYQTLFTKQRFVNLAINLKAQATLKNYTSIFIRANLNPYEQNDFYETKTGEFNSVLKRSRSTHLRGFLSTDYRKQFALDIGGGGSIHPLYNGETYHWRIAPRYRLNDKISCSYVLSIRKKYNDIGFLTNDITFTINDTIPTKICGIRNTNMITNVFSGTYILSNKMDISIKLRYHLDQVRYTSFNLLENNGNLTDSDYSGSHNDNDIYWTSDITYNWWFAPGSQVSVVWKNGIEQFSNSIENHWIDNVKNSFSSTQEYSLSFKVIYYLDYLYLKNK